MKSAYHTLKDIGYQCQETLIAASERILRFFGIPIAVLTMVEWGECRRNVLLVFWDHLYIFFVLKYFPDNYSKCRLWDVPRSEWKYYFGSGYDPRSVRRRKRHALRRDGEILFEDKEVCYHLCRSFDLPLPMQYCVAGPEDDFGAVARDLFRNRKAERLVVKLVDGAAGKGSFIVEQKGNELSARMISEPLKRIGVDDIELPTRAVIQEWVCQHPAVSGISEQALNTVRMVTMFSPDKEVIFVGAYIRIGIGDSFFDSGSSAGVKVDLETGRLRGAALDGNGRSVDFKPAGYDQLSDAVLPDWDEALDLARQVQEHFSPFNRFIGMDIGFSESGPILIEINDIFDCARFEGVTGPILKNEAVLDCCLKYEMLTHHLFH